MGVTRNQVGIMKYDSTSHVGMVLKKLAVPMDVLRIIHGKSS